MTRTHSTLDISNSLSTPHSPHTVLRCTVSQQHTLNTPVSPNKRFRPLIPLSVRLAPLQLHRPIHTTPHSPVSIPPVKRNSSHSLIPMVSHNGYPLARRVCRPTNRFARAQMLARRAWAQVQTEMQRTRPLGMPTTDNKRKLKRMLKLKLRDKRRLLLPPTATRIIRLSLLRSRMGRHRIPPSASNTRRTSSNSRDRLPADISLRRVTQMGARRIWLKA